MTAEEKTPPAGGHPFLNLLIGAILVLAGGGFYWGVAFGTLLDKFGQLSFMPTYMLFVIPIALGLLGITFWIHGHRIYARNKGISPVIGLALGFIPIIGLLLLMLIPVKHKPVLATPEAGTPAEKTG